MIFWRVTSKNELDIGDDPTYVRVTAVLVQVQLSASVSVVGLIIISNTSSSSSSSINLTFIVSCIHGMNVYC